MTEMYCLNPEFSTTRLVTTQKLEIRENRQSKVQTQLRLPPNRERISEGGLRTVGYFKRSWRSEELKSIPDVCSGSLLSNLTGKVSGKGNRKSKRQDFRRLPLVTVITVVYNRRKYLKGAIRSVLYQTYPNVEYIIIDGGSTDGTLNIIREYEGKIDYWVSEKDNGIYDAMNKGIQLSVGQIIGILNSDDWYEIYAIERVVDTMRTSSEIGLVHGAMNRWSHDGRLESTYGRKERYSDILFIPFNHPTCFFRKEVYEKLGTFDTSFRTAADYDFSLRFKKAEYKSIYIDDVLANFRKGGVTSCDGGFPSIQIWNLLKKNNVNFALRLTAIVFRLIRTSLSFAINRLGLKSFKMRIRAYLTYHK